MMFSNRNVFSHDPCVIEDGRLGIVRGGLHPWPSSAAFGILKAGSGLKPLLQKERCVWVGAPLAATLAPSKMGGSGLGEAASSVAFGISKAGVRG